MIRTVGPHTLLSQLATAPRALRIGWLGALLIAACYVPGTAQGQGGAPNVFWAIKDSIAGCPAGDTLIALNFPSNVGPRPSKLRIRVYYPANEESPKGGVPPESIWVTVTPTSGNVRLNDAAEKTFADDSTDIGGFARITLPSFSGCGTISVKLYVSGRYQGAKNATIRTADTTSDGRVTIDDVDAGLCDLNYNNVHGEGDELSSMLAHLNDWHRNALHGTLVRRTSLDRISTGSISWSPSGRHLVFSIPKNGSCAVVYVASDPVDGNDLTQLTFPLQGSDLVDDYDPVWSPLGDAVYFSRNDQSIYRKGIPGLAADTSEALIFTSATNAISPAISPNAKWIAFSQRETNQAYTLWTIPAEGGTPKRITTLGNYKDSYPQWSRTAGRWSERRNLTGGHKAIYSVPAFFEDDPPDTEPFYDAAGKNAALPSDSPDNSIIVSGVSTTGSTEALHTMDATGTSGFKPIQNYPEYTWSGSLGPTMSPDGTRLAMVANVPGVSGAHQKVWAARRNMNPPPNLTNIGGQSVAPSTARVFFTMLQGQAYQFTVSASDPADPVSDPIDYFAFFLEPGMSFVQGTRTFSWTPPAEAVGQVFHVKFLVTTPSGGMDGIIAVINVVQSVGPGMRAVQVGPDASAGLEGRGRVRFDLRGMAPCEVQLTVFDLAGRRLIRRDARTDNGLYWDGKDEGGKIVANGVYLYRIIAGAATLEGKFIYLR
jgi:hypothetical protein